MHFILLATDYDGTLAHDGEVDDSTLSALNRLSASGRKLVLVTGRHLPDLSKVFPHLDLFERIVVENGGVLYSPHSRQEKLLCDPPNQRLLDLLTRKKVPFSAGRTVVATWRPHDAAVLAAIGELGLDLQVIFNKESVMVLPSGINKQTGLQAALDELGISAHNIVAVGDAENDLPFLRMSACGAAVANALPSLKEEADLVLEEPRGEGVSELIDFLIRDDLARFDSNLRRHSISLGQQLSDSVARSGDELKVSPRGASILIAGPSASGKSTMVAGILEQLVDKQYQFCLIDPEGDYDGFTDALSFGSSKEAPDRKALLRALEFPQESAIVNMLGVALDDRAEFFSTLLPRVQDLRNRTARPHWLIIDEAHHMLSSAWSPASATIPQLLESTILITVHPDHVAQAALNVVDIVIAIGKADVITSFAAAVGIEPPLHQKDEISQGEALIWFRRTGRPPVRVKAPRSSRERLRHVRQYAEGELSAEQSFYFRGPASKLNLRAQNLKTFLQLADGVDDDTWMYHLRKGDYSRWFQSMIKDEELKRQAAEIERDQSVSAQDSREKIKQLVEARYTAPV